LDIPYEVVALAGHVSQPVALMQVVQFNPAPHAVEQAAPNQPAAQALQVPTALI